MGAKRRSICSAHRYWFWKLSCLVRDIRLIETYNWLKELEMVCAMVCRPPHPHSGWLVPVGNGTLGAVKSGIERRPERQGSISSGTRLGGATYKRHILGYLLYRRYPNEICPFGQVKLLRSEIFASQMWNVRYANVGKFHFTSNEARYFTICGRILFHVLRQQNISLTYYRPTVHQKGVTHYTLQGKVCEKEYGQKHPYSFFSFSRV